MVLYEGIHCLIRRKAKCVKWYHIPIKCITFHQICSSKHSLRCSQVKKMIIFSFSVLEDQMASDQFKIYIFLIHLEKISKVTLYAWEKVIGSQWQETQRRRKGLSFSLSYILQLNKREWSRIRVVFVLTVVSQSTNT